MMVASSALVLPILTAETTMDAKTKKQLRRLVTEFQRYSQQMSASRAQTEDQRLAHIWEGRADTAAWAAERLNALIIAADANPRQNVAVELPRERKAK